MFKSRKHLLALCALSLPLTAVAQESKPIKIIEPKKKAEPAKSATIDTEKFQLGAFVGTFSVEDFNTNPVYGLSFSYQLTPSVLLLANYGTSDVSRATVEKREGVNFLTDDQRNLTHMDLLGGYKMYTARSFWGSKRKFDSDIYLTGGVATVDFAGDSNTGVVLGASYRVVFTDWLVGTVDFRDYIVDMTDVFGTGTKSTQNLEFTIGVNALF